MSRYEFFFTAFRCWYYSIAGSVETPSSAVGTRVSPEVRQRESKPTVNRDSVEQWIAEKLKILEKQGRNHPRRIPCRPSSSVRIILFLVFIKLRVVKRGSEIALAQCLLLSLFIKEIINGSRLQPRPLVTHETIEHRLRLQFKLSAKTFAAKNRWAKEIASQNDRSTGEPRAKRMLEPEFIC